MRWPHPTLGLLSPAEFIPLAEALDLIHDIGMIVLERTCTDLQAWSSQLPFDAPLRVSVNLSARQLARPDLAAELLDVIDRSGVAHDRIRFEVTESVLAHPDGPASSTTFARIGRGSGGVATGVSSRRPARPAPGRGGRR